MKPIIKRAVLPRERKMPFWRLLLAEQEERLYVLGLQFEPTPGEKIIIETNAMAWHPVLTLYQQYWQKDSGWFADPPKPLLTLPLRNPVPFIDAVGPEFVTVVCGYAGYLAAIE